MIPIIPIEPLVLPQLGPHHDDLWTTLCDLGDAHHVDWVIIGGQMVMLHALQSGQQPGRISQDLDTVIDARVRPPALPAFLATLANLGFKSAGVSPGLRCRARGERGVGLARHGGYQTFLAVTRGHSRSLPVTTKRTSDLAQYHVRG